MRQFSLLLLLLLSLLTTFRAVCQEIPDSLTNGEHAIILKEVDRITISGNKAAYILITLHKKVKVKILDNEGIKYFNNLTIPEVHDPFVPKQAPEINNLQNHLQSTSVNEVKYWVKGKKMDAPRASHNEVLRSVNNRFIASDIFTYHFTDLAVGDVLVYEYSVDVPYTQNWQEFLGYRVFFHGVHPKLDYKFQLNLSDNLVYELFSINGATYTKAAKESYIHIEVNEKNLTGCIDEVGARAYLDLPHITFQPKPYEWLYMPYNNQYGKFIPVHICSAQSREGNSLSILKKFDTGVNEPSLNAVRKYIETNSNHKSSFQNLLEIHNDIARNFEFLDDRDYLAQYDTRKKRIGEHLLSKQLRNVARFDTYRYIFAGLNLNHNTIYPCDKRYGQVGEHYYVPMRTNDYLFISGSTEGHKIIYPKKSQQGYYAGEVPFYFEKTSGIRIVYGDIYLGINNEYKESIDYIKVPGRNPAHNTRKIFGQIEISSKGTDRLKSKVTLSGQFSTCGRHTYRNEGCDHTINPLYGKGPHQIGESSISITKEETKSPFVFACNVSSEAEIGTIKSNELTINLQKLFPHIIDQEPVALPRHLNYYPDFMGTDIIRYQVQLDADYELVEAPAFSIKNEYGEFTFQVNMNSPNTLLISSARIIKSEVVAAENIEQVIDIQNAIEVVNNTSLRLKKL